MIKKTLLIVFFSGESNLNSPKKFFCGSFLWLFQIDDYTMHFQGVQPSFPLLWPLICVCSLRVAAKKVLPLMARPLRLNPPPPLELNGRWNVGTQEKKVPKKVIFSLLARPFTPPPSLMARPLREELFFCGFPNKHSVITNIYFLLLQYCFIQKKSFSGTCI